MLIGVVYRVVLILLVAEAFYLLRVLYKHLEVEENRELFMMIVGLIADDLGNLAMTNSETISEIVLAYRIVLLGRALFGIGFILYLGRFFKATFHYAVLAIWGVIHATCIFMTFYYKYSNLFISDIRLKKFGSLVLLDAQFGIMHILSTASVLFVGFWILGLLVKYRISAKSKFDRAQRVIIHTFSSTVILLGICQLVDAVSKAELPNIAVIARAFVAVIYTIMATRYHFSNYDSVAKKMIMDSVSAGVAVLSAGKRVLFCNEIIKEIFSDLADDTIIAPYSEELAEVIDKKDFEKTVGSNTYHISVDKIMTSGHLTGYSLVATNITDYIDMEKQADFAGEARKNFMSSIAHEIRTPLNAISSSTDILGNTDDPVERNKCIQVIASSVGSLNDSISNIIGAYEEESLGDAPQSREYSILDMLAEIIREGESRAEIIDAKFSVRVSPYICLNAVGDDTRLKKAIGNIVKHAIRYTDDGGIRFEVSGKLNEDGRFEYLYTVYNFTVDDKTESGLDYESKEKERATSSGIALRLSKYLVDSLGGEFSERNFGGGKNRYSIRITQDVTDYADFFALDCANNLIIYSCLYDEVPGYDDFKVLCSMLGVEVISVNGIQKLKKHPEEDGRHAIVLGEADLIVRRAADIDKISGFFKAALIETTRNASLPTGILPIEYPLSIITLWKMHAYATICKTAESVVGTKEFMAPTAKALVVDDDQTNRDVMKLLIEKFGLEAETVESGYACLDKLKSGSNYDIIFMDYMMEGMDGVQTTQEIRKMSLEVSDIPIIAFTANEVPGAKEMYMNAGMNDCLFKPANLDKVHNILGKFLPGTKLEIAEETLEVNFPPIKGANVNEGIRFIGGNPEIYKEMLGDFAMEIDKKARLIEEYFDSDKMNEFVITVHGVKSASRTLGFEELAGEMAEMEKAGKVLNGENNDKSSGSASSAADTQDERTADRTKALEFITQNMPKVLDNYRSLYEELAGFVSDKRIKYSREISNPVMRKLLKELMAALEEYDFNAVEKATNQILEGIFDGETETLVERLAQSVHEVDYAEAAEVTEELQKMYESDET